MFLPSLRTLAAISITLPLTAACSLKEASEGAPMSDSLPISGAAAEPVDAPATSMSVAGRSPGMTTSPTTVGTAGADPVSPVAGSGGTALAASAAGAGGAAGTTASTPGTAGTDAPITAGAETGILPVPDTLDQLGPYAITDVPDTGPGNAFRLFAPEPLGAEGLKHPVVAWSPGAGAFPDAYLVFLKALASQGFVTLSYNSTASGSNLVDAIDWLLAENERADSMLYGKLDPERIAAGGHSAGSLATYEMADDPRLRTTLHMSGGSFNPQADVPRLKKPALMVCGDAGGDGLVTGDLANPMCVADFELATVPVFFAVVEGAGHTALNDADATAGAGTAPDDPHKRLFIKATIGWLRWQLANDESLKGMFVGSDCELCGADSGYVVKQKNLD